MTFGGRPPLKNVKKLKMAVDCHQNVGIPTYAKPGKNANVMAFSHLKKNFRLWFTIEK